MPTPSLWNAKNAEWSAALNENVEVDVAVVGAGITGITAAFQLMKAGLRVALIEGRRILHGETGNTTGHLSTAIDARYSTLQSRFGSDGARLAYEASRDAIVHIEKSVEAMGADCGYERVAGYLYTEHGEDLRALHVEFEAARELGVPVEMLTRAPLPFTTRGAVRFDMQAQIHPTRYLRAMVDALEAGGCRIFEGSPVTEFTDGAPCTLTTTHGKVFARAVILATNAALNRLFVQTKTAHYRSYAAAYLYDGDLPDALFWDTAEPYHYTRRALVDGVHYLIVGGEDHKTGQTETTDRSYERLNDYAREKFGVRTPTHQWSGQILEPVDGLPYIGRNSASENVYIATGFSGNGLTWGTVAGVLLSDLVVGQRNRFADLFDATRVKPLASLRTYVSENADFPAHLVADLLHKGEGGSPEDLLPGDGRVMRVNGENLALYRDAKGELHAVSPVCSHLGCHVKFNHSEKTWDCPCHGSRFTTEGAILNGPALTPLSRKSMA